MPRFPQFTVCLLVSAALLCAGCELPHGPLRWDPVHLDRLNILPHGELHAPGPFCVTDDCDDRGPRECADGRYAHEGPPSERGAPPSAASGPRLTHHHHAVPLAGPGVDAPWPKFHPVPTRPVFEARCLTLPEGALPPQQLPPQPQYLPQE